MKSFFAVPALVAGALIVAGCTPGGTIAIAPTVGAAAPAVAAGFQGSANYQCPSPIGFVLTVIGTGGTVVAYSSSPLPTALGGFVVDFNGQGGPLRYDADGEAILFNSDYSTVTYGYWPITLPACTRI